MAGGGRLDDPALLAHDARLDVVEAPAHARLDVVEAPAHARLDIVEAPAHAHLGYLAEVSGAGLL